MSSPDISSSDSSAKASEMNEVQRCSSECSSELVKGVGRRMKVAESESRSAWCESSAGRLSGVHYVSGAAPIPMSTWRDYRILHTTDEREEERSKAFAEVSRSAEGSEGKVHPPVDNWHVTV